MSYYLRNGNVFTVTDERAMDLHRTLPAGNYIIKQDPGGGLFLEMVDAFTHSGKIYGDTMSNVERIMRTFDSRSSSTGVLLTGEKGSGKTLLAKQLSISGAAIGIPTIIINAPWSGDKFNKFIQDIDQPCIVLLDEFEKVYDSGSQEQMLTLLDGVFPSKKLFILTTNDKWRVDRHMHNRPGRIFYMMDFKGLDPTFIIQYCSENLQEKQHTDTIVRISSLFDQFNFDMLKALVEEMNRYGETPQQALRLLNVRAEFGGKVNYTVELTLTGGRKPNQDSQDTWCGNPLKDIIEFELSVGDGDDTKWVQIVFKAADIRRMDGKNGVFEYVNDEGRLVLTRVKSTTFNYLDVF